MMVLFECLNSKLATVCVKGMKVCDVDSVNRGWREKEGREGETTARGIYIVRDAKIYSSLQSKLYQEATQFYQITLDAL